MSATTFESKTTRAVRIARAVLGAAAIAAASAAGAADRPAATRQQDVPSSYPALQGMKPVDVMHMIDTQQKGYVTKEEFLKFQEAVFDRIDRDQNRRLSEVEFTDRG
jgi:hypothetical protein